MNEGFQFCWNHKRLKLLFIFIAIGMFVAHSFELILLTFLTDTLRVGVENMAWIGSASIVGLMIGSVLAPKLMLRINRKWLLLPPFFFYCSYICGPVFLQIRSFSYCLSSLYKAWLLVFFKLQQSH